MRFFLIISMMFVCSVPATFAEHNPLDYILTREILFTRPYVDYFASNWPAITRVHLDLSLDDGATWHKRIAHGLDAQWGTNIYSYSLRVTPDLWTENARIGLRTLWASTTNSIVFHEGDLSGKFTIAGVRILTPTSGAVVLQPGYMQLTWHEAGPDYVDIGVSTNAGATWTEIYTVESKTPTNTWYIPITGYPTGRLDFVIMAYTNLYATVRVEVQNQ